MKKNIIFIILLFVFISPINTFALNKTETIYNNLDYNGKVTKKVINNHLYNIDNDSIEDNSLLENIINLNGDEKFTYTNNKLTFENKGKEIYYQGTIKKENPISFKITYYLNNKKVNPKNVVGKKGNIKIKINVTNNSYNSKYKVYNPFVVTMGTIINNEDNTNIKVTNGSVVSTGTKSFVVALSSPGMNYNINNSYLNGLDNITISYKTNSFSLKNLYFVATPKLLSKVDIDKINKLDELSNSITLLKTNMDKLDEGSVKLLNGSNDLYKGSKDLNNGLVKINDVINKMDNGVVTLDQGLKMISSQVTSLNTELNNTFTPEVISNLNNLLQVDKNFYDIKVAYDNEYGFGYLKDTSYDKLKYLLDNHIISETEYSKLCIVKKTYEESSDLCNLGYNNYFAVSSLVTLINKLQLVNQLDISLNTISSKVSDLSNGLNETSKGSLQLVEGSTKLSNGLLELNNGLNTVSNGITTINKEGISKLYEYSNTISNYGKQVKNIVKASKEYSGYSSNNSDNTVFIYKVKSAK